MYVIQYIFNNFHKNSIYHASYKFILWLKYCVINVSKIYYLINVPLSVS